MRALVTGGAGFIGSHIADRLLEEGYQVRILDNLEPRVHPKGKPAWVPQEAEFIEGDVRDRQVLAQALDGVQVVFHEAAYQDYMPDFSKFLHVNSVSTALIHELILSKSKELGGKGRSVEKVVVASSQAVYGEGQYRCKNLAAHELDTSSADTDNGRYLPVIQPECRSREQMERGQWEVVCPVCGAPMENLCLREEYHNPFNAYAISKLGEELAAVRLGRLHDIPSVALRYSIVQGPRQSLYNQYSGICRIFSTRLLNDLPPVIYEDGMQKRDYTHIADVVEANMTVLRDERADYRVFNVGSGREITVREYARALAQKLDKEIEAIIPGEYRLGDNRHSVSDIARLKELGWSPQRELGDVFEDYLVWIESQGDVGEFFQEADRAMRKEGVVRKVTL
jgi:dTDP-L-rhamnose 4-epimerase